MSAARAPGNRRLGGSFIWVTIAIALAIHGTLLGTSNALGLTFFGGAIVAPKVVPTPVAEVEEPELKASCAGDTYLASFGRTVMCFAPWSDADREQCAYEAQMSLYMDLGSCTSRNEPIATAVSMIPNPVIEKLPQIDPERLLDESQPPPPEEPKPPELQQQQPQVAPPPPPPPAPTKPAQVVETAKPNEETEEPENARYLAEYNTKVDKQKVNRGARNEPIVAKAKPEELKPSEKPKDDPSVKEQKDQPPGKNDGPPAPGSMAMRKPGSPQKETVQPQEEHVRGSSGGAKGPTVADGYMGRKGDGAIEQQQRPREEEKVGPRGQNGGGGGAPPVPNLKPSKEQLERALGGGNVDHVDDADNDDETALNAKRWVFASFFNRLKRQVAQNWEPASVWRRIDPNGNTYGFKTRVTEVRVTLAANGVLDKILVTSPSGVGELDDEAVRAFKAAAPFPNPPDGLVKEGRITFAFSFYFEIGQPRSSWRVIRSQ